jgi:hypothetical protein
MISIGANLVGTGAGIIVILFAWLLTRHVLDHCPGFLREWAERLIIILMYAGGAALAATSLGDWSRWLIEHVADVFGGLNAGIPRTALVATALVLLFAVVMSLIFAPNAATGLVAACLPLVLGLVAGGVIHQIYMQTAVPAQAFASSLSALIGG